MTEPGEGRDAEVAREMLASGDWVTPHYDSLVYLDAFGSQREPH